MHLNSMKNLLFPIKVHLNLPVARKEQLPPCMYTTYNTTQRNFSFPLHFWNNLDIYKLIYKIWIENTIYIYMIRNTQRLTLIAA